MKTEQKVKSFLKQLLLCFLLSAIPIQAEGLKNNRTVKWPPVPEASGYFIEISTNKSFTTIVETKKTKSSSFEWTGSDPGIFYLRVASIDQGGILGKPSNISQAIVNYPPAELYFPKQGTLLVLKNLEGITFLWEKIGAPLLYSFSLERTNPSKAKIATEKKTYQNSLKIDSLEDGTYLWRVGSLYAEQTPIVYSAPVQFTVENTLLPTVLVSPQQTAQLMAGNGKNTSVRFNWNSSPNAKNYELVVAKDSGFNDVIQTASTNTTNAEIPLSPSEYFWKVRPVSANQKSGPWSNTGSFKVARPPEFSSPVVIYPEQEARLASQSSNYLLNLQWQSSGSNLAKGFEVQINNRSNPTGAPKSFYSKQPKTKTNLKPGRYSVRVRGVIGAGTFGDWSDQRNFEISQEIKKAPPPKPKERVVKLESQKKAKPAEKEKRELLASKKYASSSSFVGSRYASRSRSKGEFRMLAGYAPTFVMFESQNSKPNIKLREFFANAYVIAAEYRRQRFGLGISYLKYQKSLQYVTKETATSVDIPFMYDRLSLSVRYALVESSRVDLAASISAVKKPVMVFYEERPGFPGLEPVAANYGVAALEFLFRLSRNWDLPFGIGFGQLLQQNSSFKISSKSDISGLVGLNYVRSRYFIPGLAYSFSIADYSFYRTATETEAEVSGKSTMGSHSGLITLTVRFGL